MTIVDIRKDNIFVYSVAINLTLLCHQLSRAVPMEEFGH